MHGRVLLGARDRGHWSPGSCWSPSFCLHALRVERPLLDLRLYAAAPSRPPRSTMFCLGGALFGAMILLPLYYQQVRHESVIDTGLLLGPQGLGMAFVMPFVGRLTERFGGGRACHRRRATWRCSPAIPLGLIGAHTSIVWLSRRDARARRRHRLRVHARDRRGVRALERTSSPTRRRS